MLVFSSKVVVRVRWTVDVSLDLYMSFSGRASQLFSVEFTAGGKTRSLYKIFKSSKPENFRPREVENREDSYRP